MAYQKLIAILTVGPLNPGDVVTIPHTLVQSDTDPHIEPLVVYPDRATAIAVVGTPTNTDITFQNLGSVQEPQQKFIAWREATILSKDPKPGIFWRGLGPNSGGGGGIDGFFNYGQVKTCTFTGGALTAIGTHVGVYNVYDYGAVADYGAGDTDNGPFFQAAFDACVAGGGGTVYVPPGKYFIATGIAVDLSAGATLDGINVAFRGEGMGTELVVQASDANGNPALVNTNMIAFTPSAVSLSVVTVSDFVFRRIDTGGPDPWIAKRVLFFDWTGSLATEYYPHAIVERCQFLGLAITTAVVQCTEGMLDMRDCTMAGCAISGQLNGGVNLFQVQQAVVKNLTHQTTGIYLNQNWNEGSIYDLIRYQAPPQDSNFRNEGSVEVLYCTAGVTAHRILNVDSGNANHRADRVLIANCYHLTQGIANDALCVFYQTEHVQVDRCDSENGNLLQGWDMGDVIVKNSQNGTVLIDLAPWGGPYTRSAHIIECTLAGIFPNELSPITQVKETFGGRQFTIVFSDEAIAQYAAVKTSGTNPVNGWRVVNMQPEDQQAFMRGIVATAAGAVGDPIRLAELRGQAVYAISDGAAPISIGDRCEPSSITAGELEGGATEFCALALEDAVAVAGTVFLVQLRG